MFEVLLNSKDILDEYKKKYREGRINEKNYRNKIKFYQDKKVKRNEEFVELIRKMDLIGDVDLLIENEKKKYKDDILEIDKNIIELNEYIDKLELLENNELIESRIKEDMELIYGNKRIKDRKRFLDKYIDKVYINRKSKSIKELVYDINVKFKFDINYMKNFNGKKVNNMNNVGDKNFYKLKNTDINQTILMYKSLKKIIKIDLLVNVLLFKNIDKNYGISYLRSKIKF